jgi:hypothetical protein
MLYKPNTISLLFFIAAQNMQFTSYRPQIPSGRIGKENELSALHVE